MLKQLTQLVKSPQLTTLTKDLFNITENTTVFLSDFTIAPLLATALKPPFVYITSTRESTLEAKTIFENCGLKAIACSNVPDMPIYTENPQIQNTELTNAVNLFMSGANDVLILPTSTLLCCIPQANKQNLTLKQNDKIKIKDLIETLEDFGFTRTQTISTPGDYTIRGDVADIFPENTKSPIRIMFFDDVVEQIKTINLQTFLSTGNLNTIQIFPITELANISNERVRQKLESLKPLATNDNTRTILNTLLTRAEKFENLTSTRWLLPFLADLKPTLDVLLNQPKPNQSDNLKLVFDRPRDILDTLRLAEKQNSARLASLLESGLLLPEHAQLFTDISTVIKDLNCAQTLSQSETIIKKPATYVAFQTTISNHDLFRTPKTISLNTLPTTNYFSAISILTPDLIRNTETHKKTVLVFTGTSRALENYLTSKGVPFNVLTREDFERCNEKSHSPSSTISAQAKEPDYIIQNQINIIYTPLSVSFELADARTVIYSVSPTPQSDHGTLAQNVFNNSISNFMLPSIGEVVVHESHGLGRYLGIKKLTLSDVERDYIVLQYDGGSFVYLPPEQTNLLSNYTGEPTRLNRIGGKDFASAKQRVRRRLKELSFKLSKLYAKRNAATPNHYDADESIMDEFARNFPHQYTPDQLLAIKDIKHDMTGYKEKETTAHPSSQPKDTSIPNPQYHYRTKVMDRLICGDVGFGKTEVSLHAVLRAVESGYQCALLCPTTILSVQHANTARKRLEQFGVRVEVLNRFRTPKETEEILRDTANGKIDLLIGTHRILSPDIKFKNLSLLILDEEQRFGVAHKEKIKQLKTNIDVITLSATPIPRTLNMAMIGIRDISNILTAPKNRNPVITYVTEESDALLTDAIIREHARGGQTLILYNNVERIEHFTAKLHKLLNKYSPNITTPDPYKPHINIAIAHGQMSSTRLENTIVATYNREIDVLVASTIIENGIDISSANTLIVIDADRLGVAQMHQLRGRVGRSTTQAFAYFTFNSNKEPSEISRQRLLAIQSHSGHGSGMDIAMRDLKLRGAGDLLGAKQSGHIEQIGFDMYCKILRQVAKENKMINNSSHTTTPEYNPDSNTETNNANPFDLQQDNNPELPDPVLDISLNSFIPQTYIESESERLKIYRAISEINSRQDCDKILIHLADIYGKPPTEVKNIVIIGLTHSLAKNKSIKHIRQNKSECRIIFHSNIDQHQTIKTITKTLQDKNCQTQINFHQKENLHLSLKTPTLGNLITFLETI